MWRGRRSSFCASGLNSKLSDEKKLKVCLEYTCTLKTIIERRKINDIVLLNALHDVAARSQHAVCGAGRCRPRRIGPLDLEQDDHWDITNQQ